MVNTNIFQRCKSYRRLQASLKPHQLLLILIASSLVILALNPYPAKLFYLNFQPFEVVSRYSDTQLQMAENYSYLFNLSTNICKS